MSSGIDDNGGFELGKKLDCFNGQRLLGFKALRGVAGGHMCSFYRRSKLVRGQRIRRSVRRRCALV
jgi:hypothetical protein